MDSKDRYSSIFLKAAEEEIDDKKLEQCRYIWWYNIRNKHDSGLRLTDDGLSYIIETADIKTYTIDIPKEIKITGQILIWLDRFISSPWHLNKHKITVLSEKAAFELYLFSGDVKKLGQNKAIAKRLENSEFNS